MHFSSFLASILFQTLALAFISTFTVAAVVDVDYAPINADTNIRSKSITNSRRVEGDEAGEEICSDILLEEDYLTNAGQLDYLQTLLTQAPGTVIDYSVMKTYMEETEEYCTTTLNGDFFTFTIEEDEQCAPFSNGLGGDDSTYYLIKDSPICLSACKSVDAALAAFLTREGNGCNGKITFTIVESIAPSIDVSTAPTMVVVPGTTPSPTEKKTGAGSPNSSNTMDGRFVPILIIITIVSITLM
mmetsp:Transcript_8008/g.9994  ORF Transcript_8008/g.9994 Transcript_8008/m.9994 type:complete len:244 (+) Transcript_8008:70-801(+)